MIIYEVNLTINSDIFHEFYEWLLPHVREVLQFTGFIKSEIGLVENQHDDHKNHLRISYTIDSYENLQGYLDHHAARMRANTVERFGSNFTADRRIIVGTVVVDNHSAAC